MQKKLPLINSAHGSETRNIINEIIKMLNNLGYTYNESLQKAHDILDEAQQTNDMNESVQQQINTLIAESGTSDSEVLQARVDGEGNEYTVLKERLDKKEEKTNLELTKAKRKIFNSEVMNHRHRKPLISIIDDDGYEKVYTMLKPLAEQYNIPIASAPITSLVGEETYPSRYNLEQMKEMQSIGMEFLSHGHTNMRFGDQTEDVIDADLKQSMEWMLENGFNNTGFVIPFGSTNDTVEKVARRYFRSAIFNGGNTQINYPPIDTYRIERTSNDAGLAVMKERVDEAIENDGWLIIMTHVDGANHTQDDYDRIEYELEELIKYAQAQDIEFVTIEDGLDIYGNVIDVDGKRIGRVGADGSLSGSLGATKFLRSYEIDINQNIDLFDNETITIAHFSLNSGGDAGLPANGFGFVATYKGFSDDYNYQTFYHLSTGNTYRRRFNNGAWEDWVADSVSSSSVSLTLGAGWSGGLTLRPIDDHHASIAGVVYVDGTTSNVISELDSKYIPQNFALMNAVNRTKMQPANNFYIDNNLGLRAFGFDGLEVGDQIRINDTYRFT